MMRPAVAQPLRSFAQRVEGALRLTFTWRSKATSSVSARLESAMMPALLTSTSTPPNAASAASNMPRTACRSLASALTVLPRSTVRLITGAV